MDEGSTPSTSTTPRKHKSKVLDTNMNRRDWEKRAKERTEVRTALIWTPIILVGDAVVVVGFLRLLQVCGLL